MACSVGQRTKLARVLKPLPDELAGLEELEKHTLSSDSGGDELSKPKLNPQQFAVMDFFRVLVSVALALTIVMPWIRALPAKVFATMIVVIGGQIAWLTVLLVFLSRRRKRLLEKSGQLLFSGSSSENPSCRWAKARAVFGVLFCVVIQLFVAAALSWVIVTEVFTSWLGRPVSILILINGLLGPSMAVTSSIRFLRWRLYPETVEFYENGIAISDRFVPWEKLDLRRSTIWHNRVQIVFTQQQSSSMVWVHESEIDSLIAYASEKRTSIAADPTLWAFAPDHLLANRIRLVYHVTDGPFLGTGSPQVTRYSSRTSKSSFPSCKC